MKQLTVSSLNRVMKCRPSAPGVLPSAREESSEAAQNGTAVHAYLDACIKIGREQALEQCSERWPDMEPTFAAIDLSQIPAGQPDKFQSELAFAIEMVSGDVQIIDPHDESHHYIPPDAVGHWLYGTADVVGVGEDHVLVYDYKTGRAPLGMASNSWQLKALAYAAATVYGKGKAIVALIRIIPDRPPVYYSAEFDAFELAKIGHDLRELSAYLRRQKTSSEMIYAPGDHCRYCPALRFCTANLLTVAALSAGNIPGDIPELLAPELAGRAWSNIKLLEEYIERAKTTLKHIAESTPLILPNGTHLAAVEQIRESVDAEIAREVLLGMDFEDAARTAVESVLKTSKDAIKKALREEGLKGKPLTEAYEEALRRIRVRGGATESAFSKLTEIELKDAP